MRVETDKILNIMNLRVGDKIKVPNINNGVYEVISNIHAYDIQNCKTLNLTDLILLEEEYEILEDRFYDIDSIQNRDVYYHIENGKLAQTIYTDSDYDRTIFKNSIPFTKEEYALEYLKSLVEFNNKYKEGII